MPPKTYRAMIRNLLGIPVPAVASFPYRGWTISLSTLPGRDDPSCMFTEVMVWQQGHEKETSVTFITVEDAIRYVDQTVDV